MAGWYGLSDPVHLLRDLHEGLPPLCSDSRLPHVRGQSAARDDSMAFSGWSAQTHCDNQTRWADGIAAGQLGFKETL